VHAEKNCSPWSGIHIQYSDPDLTSGFLIEDLGLDPQLFGAKVRGLESLGSAAGLKTGVNQYH